MIRLISGENMHQKLFATLILITFLLLLLQPINAIKYYLRPQLMIIRVNTSDTAERSLVIYNNNTIKMGINATISGNISEVITIKNPTFELLENETRNIDFVTKANNPGVYSGQITVTYTTDVATPVDIPSDITVIATGTPARKIDFVTILIIVLIIVVIILLLVKYKRGSKRWGK